MFVLSLLNHDLNVFFVVPVKPCMVFDLQCSGKNVGAFAMICVRFLGLNYYGSNVRSISRKYVLRSINMCF